MNSDFQEMSCGRLVTASNFAWHLEHVCKRADLHNPVCHTLPPLTQT